MREIRIFYVDFFHQTPVSTYHGVEVGVGVGFGFLFQRFGHTNICLSTKEGNVADANIFDGPVDVGINEILRRLTVG